VGVAEVGPVLQLLYPPLQFSHFPFEAAYVLGGPIEPPVQLPRIHNPPITVEAAGAGAAEQRPEQGVAHPVQKHLRRIARVVVGLTAAETIHASHGGRPPGSQPFEYGNQLHHPVIEGAEHKTESTVDDEVVEVPCHDAQFGLESLGRSELR
jgi:hypothetical protein